jgi:CubicO group peptidase (beta-lactamase class C family)
VFEIGSITKVFTATLLADMAARGEVGLTDPVSRHLPRSVTVPSRGGREITLLDLSTHHSGLPRMPDNFDPRDRTNPYADYTADRLYAFLGGHQLRRDPGAEFEYSNVGVGLLGHALGRAAGTSIQDLTARRILAPLGMKLTGFAIEGELAQWNTAGHDSTGKVAPYWAVTTLAGAGGLRSNAEDMLAFLAANMGPATTELQRAMRATHQVQKTMGPRSAIGMNWSVGREGERTILSHNGGTAGYRAMIGFDPEKRVGFVMLANSGGFRDDLGMDFLRRGPPLAIAEVQVARETLASYAGEYEIAPGRSAIVKLENEGWLTIRMPGNVRFRMHAESDDRFFLKRTPWRFTFGKDASGAVSGFTMEQGGQQRQARKVK